MVTGAAGGLGRALALESARRGADVALVDVDAEGLASCRAEVESRGRRASVHHLDVADDDAVSRLSAEVEAALGPTRLLVHNAGVTLLGRFEEASRDDLEWILDVNLRASWSMTRAFLPTLRRAAPARIVLISSVLGLFGAPGQVAYCTTKAAIAGFGRALREELRGSGVTVTVAYPGAVRTGILAAARSAGAEDRARRSRLESFLARKGVAPERAARRILDAAGRGRARVLAGRGARWLDLAARIAPGLPGRWVSRRDLLGPD